MIVRLSWRAALGVVTILLATALLYVAIRLVPGTPWADDPSTPQDRIQEWATRHHLDRPPAAGYLLWLRDVASGDLGTSYVVAAGEGVGALILRALPYSLALGVLGFGAAVVVSVAAGFASARRPGGPWDRTWSGLLYLLSAAPSFWIAMLLQDLLALRFGVLPPFGAGPAGGVPEGVLTAAAARIPFWILPPACLALGSLAFLFRFTRATLLDAAGSAYVLSARARGLPEILVLGRHAFAGARIHLVTLAGLLTPSIIGGSVIIESIFGLPGLGRLFFTAVGARDYPVVMGVGLLMAVASIVGSALADILYAAVEPRLRGAPEIAA